MHHHVKSVVILCVLAGLAMLFTFFQKAEGDLVELAFGPKDARILAFGDMFFDRSIRTYADNEGFDYLFSCMDNTLKKYDLVFGNLESPITSNPSVSQGSQVGEMNNFIFTSPIESAKALYWHNIHLVNLGNNHINNFGWSGLHTTEDYLKKAGVGYFGGLDGDEQIFHTLISNVPIAFISYNEFGGKSADAVAASIHEEKANGNTVIVYTHWGDEYLPPPERIKTKAHLFIDAGADIVIGSHPHVVNEHEVYKGKYIYYSLGNFIFDQYFSDAVDHGLALDLSISKDSIYIKELPVTLGKDRRTCFDQKSN
jgi:poly-gamma-glutamate synthesis protein (capsule biosynthesis protein)